MKIENDFSKNILIKTRDRIIDNCFEILKGQDKSISGKLLHEKLSTLSCEQIDDLRVFIVKIVDMTLHELMYNFDESKVFKIVSDYEDETTDVKSLNDEWLVGLFLDAIDLFSKYNNSYNIVTNGCNVEK